MAQLQVEDLGALAGKGGGSSSSVKTDKLLEILAQQADMLKNQQLILSSLLEDKS